MKRIIYGTLPFVCMVCVLLFINKAKPIQNVTEHFITAQKGLLTIPSHQEEDVFNITGLWHFTPNQFYCFQNSAQPQYAPLPGRLSESSLKTNIGYASYGLRIVGLNPDRIYAIRINHILSSCTVVINGMDRASQGQPGISESTEVPGMRSSIAVFKPLKNGTADIILNISNFHNRYGGTEKAILLGSAKVLNNGYTFDLIFYNIACVLLFVFSCFFILLHLNYKKMPYILWFALAGLTMSIRIASFYPHILAHIWPGIPWKLYFFLRYANIPISVLFVTVFIKKVLHICYTLFYNALLLLCLISTLFIVLASTQFISAYLYLQQAIILVAAVYNSAVIIYGFIQKREYVWWIAATLCILVIFAVHDTLVSQWIISGTMLLQEGGVVAIIIIVIMSINGYASSMYEIERLAEQQRKIQAALRRFVPNQLLFFLHKNNITEIDTGDSSDFPAMTVLSIDIRSFTSISEQLQPDEVFMLLNKYFATVAPIIRKYGGVIMKFLGDGFTALFAENPDHAVLCAIEIQQKLQEENISIKNMPPIQAGIGIDSGEILLGVIGNDNRLDSIVISNTCYTLETLQEATKKYASLLIISESVFRSLHYRQNYHIRCIQAQTGTNVLYEVYNNDNPLIQRKKDKTAAEIEAAIKKIQEKKYASAQTHIARALDIFPEDPLAIYYQKVIKAYI
ncbi:MAG: adenylate/guanylate cyclase domain-containing protein [Treponema sp.]